MKRAQQEHGTSLVLALVFITVVGGMVGGLLDLGSTNLASTSSLRIQRNRVYAATSAAEMAIRNADINNTCASYTSTVNDISANVTCANVLDTASGITREFTVTINGDDYLKVAVYFDETTGDPPAIGGWHYGD